MGVIMEKLCDKLYKYVFMNHLVSLEDIKDIANILDSYFRDKIYNGIDFLEDNANPLTYSFRLNKIRAVYKSLKDKVLNVYQNSKFSKIIDFVSFFNIYIIFLLFHEFRHSMQAFEIEIKSPLGSLYKKSVDFISIEDSLSKIAHMAIYQMYHDHFLFEVNANYMAFLWLIELLELLEFNNVRIFEGLFIDKMQGEYDFKDYEFFHGDAVGDKDIIEELKGELSIKEQILNGIYVPDPKTIKIHELLLK